MRHFLDFITVVLMTQLFVKLILKEEMTAKAV